MVIDCILSHSRVILDFLLNYLFSDAYDPFHNVLDVEGSKCSHYSHYFNEIKLLHSKYVRKGYEWNEIINKPPLDVILSCFQYLLHRNVLSIWHILLKELEETRDDKEGLEHDHYYEIDFSWLS